MTKWTMSPLGGFDLGRPYRYSLPTFSSPVALYYPYIYVCQTIKTNHSAIPKFGPAGLYHKDHQGGK
jgi:hypothetical protein